MQPPSLFSFHDPVEFLNAWLTHSQARNPRFSLRAWARQLGLSHVAMLSMVLARKRKLLPSLSSRISELWVRQGRLSAEDSRYFDLLVLHANARTDEEKEFYARLLARLRPDQQFATLELDRLRALADWTHFAVLEMTELKGFRPDPRWISLRLGGSVKPSQASDIIERLLRLGLLEKRGERLVKTNAWLATPTDRPNASLRALHRQFLERAQEALETIPAGERDITAHLTVGSRAQLAEAKRRIREFRRELATLLGGPGNGDSLYLLNIQLFDVLKLGKNKNGEKQK